MKFNWTVPVRLKIVLLIAGALFVSLLTYLALGTRLTINDKISYIYDFNLTRVQSASKGVENQVEQILATQTAMGSAFSSKRYVSNLFKENSEKLSMTGLTVYQATGNNFRNLFSLGKEGSLSHTAFVNANWKVNDFKKNNILISSVNKDQIIVGSWVVDKNRRKLFFSTLIKPNFQLEETAQSSLITLLNAQGQPLFTDTKLEISSNNDELRQFFEKTAEGKFSTGMKDIVINGEGFIAGYRKLSIGGLTVAGIISKETAFSASRALVTRSVVAGISVLLLAIGVTLIFVKKLTGSLKQMWFATQRVAEGDFSFRVETENMSNDEVGGLAVSFNAMADKIDELMQQTALKASMEKELETAQAVQGNLFPEKGYGGQKLNLAGQSIAATQCGGDWWYYAQLGDQLLIIIGDVTGHGVSAALLTAAAHGAFSTFVKAAEDRPNEKVSIARLAEHLNIAILAAAKRQSTMTCLICSVNLKTGLMEYVNASHRPPYLYRKQDGRPPLKCFTPLIDAQYAALGFEPELKPTPATFQLLPGDMLFGYTDGLVECQNPKGETMRSTMLLRILAKITDENPSDSTKICNGLMGEAMSFFGEAAKTLADDVTIAVAAIPKDAGWTAAPQ